MQHKKVAALILSALRQETGVLRSEDVLLGPTLRVSGQARQRAGAELQ